MFAFHDFELDESSERRRDSRRKGYIASMRIEAGAL